MVKKIVQWETADHHKFDDEDTAKEWEQMHEKDRINHYRRRYLDATRAINELKQLYLPALEQLCKEPQHIQTISRMVSGRDIDNYIGRTFLNGRLCPSSWLKGLGYDLHIVNKKERYKFVKVHFKNVRAKYIQDLATYRSWLPDIKKDFKEEFPNGNYNEMFKKYYPNSRY